MKSLPPEDPVKKLAEKLRSKGGIEWRSAVLQDQRVEVVRGKDFGAYFRQHEDLLQQFVSKSEARSWIIIIHDTQAYSCASMPTPCKRCSNAARMRSATSACHSRACMAA